MKLNDTLETEKLTALLANFTQMLSGSPWAALVDVDGNLLSAHPPTNPGIRETQLRSALEKAQQHGRLSEITIGATIPVRARGELVGALIVATAQALQPHEAAALKLLSRVLSLMIENSLTQKELFREAMDRYRELDMLYRVSDTIAASLDLRQVNRLLLDECVQLVKADEGAVMLTDRENGQLTVWASRGLDAATEIKSGIPLGHELSVQVVQSGQPQIFEQEVLERPSRPLQELLCVPLKTKDGVLGVISLAHTDPERTFRTADIRLLTALAGPAAIAIGHARMFGDLSALHVELEEANRRMLELDRLKSSFLGVITHELRSPVANVVFSLQVIEKYGIDAWQAEQQEQWGELVRLLQQAKEMIDNLVSFAGLLSKQGDLFMAEVDVPTLAQEIAEALAPVAQARKVTLRLKKCADVPPIMADKMRLAEAFYHLVHNAIKFNHSGGTVDVRCQVEDGGVTVTVQDTGVGIPADKLESLGNPFSQLADPLRRGVEGLGLGLALVNYVVNAHGGKLGIASQEGVGSTFAVWLPMNKG